MQRNQITRVSYFACIRYSTLHFTHLIPQKDNNTIHCVLLLSPRHEKNRTEKEDRFWRCSLTPGINYFQNRCRTTWSWLHQLLESGLLLSGVLKMVEIRWWEVRYSFWAKNRTVLLWNRSWKGSFCQNTPRKSWFLDFHVLISHVKLNHHDEHGRYLWFNRQHYFLSHQKPLSCPPFWCCNCLF